MVSQGEPHSADLSEATHQHQLVIAVDLGGTNLRAAAVSPDGKLIGRREVPTGGEDGPQAVIARIANLIAEVAADFQLGPDVPAGVTAPGPLNPQTGVVHFTPNLAGWRDVPLRDQLASKTGRKVSVGNDGNCAALGEARFGVGIGARDLVYFALGTGVGGGILSGGRLVEGVLGFGGEVGHIVVDQGGPRCRCGNVGCLEAFTSGWAIARDGELVAATADGATLRELAAGGPVSARVVAQAASAGDHAARAILRRAGYALGAALGSFIDIFNPEIIVLGGGIAESGAPLLEPAFEAVQQHAFPGSRTCAKIVRSSLGMDTALFGAAALVLTPPSA